MNQLNNLREKEQPEHRIHSVPGAMRKNRRFVLMLV
jgi:hypothetical protein